MTTAPKPDPLTELRRLYRQHAGMETVSGLNPLHFGGFRDASFTHFVRDGQSLTQDLGISLHELMMLERFCRLLQPRCIFIVGNGFGWSALGLSLLNPRARVVVVEPSAGIELTNRIAIAEGLDCRVIQGFSPADTARIVAEHCPEPPGLVLIDGQHTNEQVAADFAAIARLCGRGAAYFFHDIVNFRLFAGLAQVAEGARANGMVTELLLGTPSGMAIVYDGDAGGGFVDLVRLFNPSAEGLLPVARAAGTAVPGDWPPGGSGSSA
jgi:hypothetical protein